jgi:hypothetical protein
MAAMYVVIVSARARSLGDECSNMLNSGKTARGAAIGGGRHGELRVQDEGWGWGCEAQFRKADVKYQLLD